MHLGYTNGKISKWRLEPDLASVASESILRLLVFSLTGFSVEGTGNVHDPGSIGYASGRNF